MKNPVPPSSANSRVKNAAQGFKEFTGHNPSHYKRVKVKPIEVGYKFGKLDGVLYTTKRDGKIEHYIHEFKESAKPDLVSDNDGSQIQIVGGNYRFTDRGIIDN